MGIDTAIKGLSASEVVESRMKNGINSLDHQKENGFWSSIMEIIKEPMFLLLVVATSIYFITGEYNNGIFMLVAIILIASISLYQVSKSKNAIKALEKLTQPKSKVIREGKLIEINSEEIVKGDCIQIEEGNFLPADGLIIKSHDFSVNESILTGESFSVIKNEVENNPQVFQGTTVTSGLAICLVTAVGNQTQLGKIGKSLTSIEEEKTPLQKQIENFAKKMSILGLAVFGIVWGINYYQSRLFLDSLIKALTIAMSIIPEEIPVAFTTFMALGAWRLMKMGIIVKHTKTVETLGSATVICTDKTGTITENKMSLVQCYTIATNQISGINAVLCLEEKELLTLAMRASEPIPFDPMEIALHDAYNNLDLTDHPSNFELIYEYPLEGKPPMMTHIFENNKGIRMIAAKGAPEAIMACSNLSDNDKKNIQKALTTMTHEGFRVLAVGEAKFYGANFPKKQQDLPFEFKGLVAFYDPPKSNIKAVFETFYKAGIDIKIITGDNVETSTTIAKQVGFKNHEKTLSGDELMAMNDDELKQKVMATHLFTRMFPEAKLKIIQALKENNQIVAMTGDGVNDGPALKSAHIGIAMGKRGTEIAKQAANLILIEDDFSKMTDAIAMGRKIYVNLKKAIQYIISIHIPIILIVLIPLSLGWNYPIIFSPIHIIFLELIMGPTCSIIYENEPMEQNLMELKPRPLSITFFNYKEIAISIIQGLIITVGLLFVYQFSLINKYSEDATRTMIFLTLISSNVFLTLVNRSFDYSIFTTIRYKNNLVIVIIAITVFTTSLFIFIPPLSQFFQFERISILHFGISTFVSVVSVCWIEIYKLIRRI
jgi:Ca2+-transporting ATPase